MAQGAVQEQAARRLLTPVSEERCEVWRGDIRGNDPTAEITVRLCTREGRVTGTFSWSSRESGWDHRALVGEWRDDASLLVARDTAMIEAHPLHGWTLCTADAYSLRRTSPDRLEGTYSSARCHDHGRLSMTRVAVAPSKPEGDAAPTPRTVDAPRLARIAVRTHTARCSAAPGLPGASSAWAMVLGGAMLVMARRRRA
jgi:hypothetical protein